MEEFYVDLEFPRAVLPKSDYLHAVNDRCSNSHIFFRAPIEEQISPLYAGDSKALLRLNYFVDDSIFENPDVMNSCVKATLYENNKEPQTINEPFSKFQTF